MVFLNFNLDLFTAFICYLSVVDVVKFDSSVCNHFHRNIFLENLNDCGSVVCFEGPPSHLVSEQFILYMSIRNLYLRSIHLNNKLFLLHKVRHIRLLHDDKVEECLLRMAPKFIVVSFVGCTGGSSFWFRTLLAYAVKLESLSVTRTWNSFFQILEIISNCCPNLTYLDLSHTCIGDRHMKYLLEIRNLVALRMNRTDVSNELFAKLVCNNKQLQILEIGWMFQNGSPVCEMIPDCKNMTVLDLTSIGNLDLDIGKRIVRHCSALTYLDIKGCESLLNDDFFIFLSDCKLNLITFDMSCGRFVSDVALEVLFSRMTSITDLGIGGTSPSMETINMILNLLRLNRLQFHLLRGGLSYIDVWNLLATTFSEILEIDNIGHVIRGVPKSPPHGPSKGYVFKHIILDQHPHVETLKLCRSFGQFDIDTASNLFNSEFKFLSSLTLKGVDNPNCLVKIAQRCKTLTILGFLDCSHIKSREVVDMLRANPKLIKLRCENCPMVDDNILYFLQYNRKRLQSLVMLHCDTHYADLLKFVKRMKCLVDLEYNCVESELEEEEFSAEVVIGFSKVLGRVELSRQKIVEIIDLTV